MLKSINLSETYLYNHRFRQESKKEFELTRKNIEKIKRIAFKQISYPELKEAYDYVDNLFPRVKVKNISIYKVAAIDLKKMGYGGAEGFYDRISKIIVVCGTRKPFIPVDRRYHAEAKVTKDEVVVHELCHYCYVFEGNRSVSSEMREEFAYGWSIGYLKSKGYSDEYIIKYNFLPYLINISYEQATKNILAKNKISNREYDSYSIFENKEFNRKYSGKIFLRAKEIAMEKGQKLIDSYSKKIEEGTGCLDEEVDDSNRFNILDL